jgi:hypothetical protein
MGWDDDSTFTAVTSNPLLDGEAYLRPIGAAFELLGLSVFSDSGCDRIGRIIAWAARLAAERFPRVASFLAKDELPLAQRRLQPTVQR